MKQPGFTLVELVLVLLVVGVLAVFALPRLSGVNSYRDRAWSDQVLAMLRHAQKLAIARNGQVYVRLDEGSIALCLDAACAQPVPPPIRRNSGSAATLAACGNNSNWYCEALPAGVSHAAGNGTQSYIGSAPTFYFDSQGRPANSGDLPPASSFNARLTLTIQGEGQPRSIHVEQETGYVHP